MNIETDKISLAARFVNSTQQHIFLTGKAGTGKTTFLRDLAERTHKRFVIVAPTGIAALNAQGVTIHSQFQLPFGSFIPDQQIEAKLEETGQFCTQRMLSYKHHLSAAKRQVLRAIDLLIIDEVSMLRADVLDAIDYRLRQVKGNYDHPFGGVQVLMIGDLYQLPPIVKREEWPVLSQYYSSMHFFEARALKQAPPIFLELDKIFRQEDETFIGILNNLRNDALTSEDLEILNAHHKSEEEIRKEKDLITLTTHNYKADKINGQELDALKGKEWVFEAEIDGHFPENLFPLPEEMRLKVGAQVMFIKNDRSGEGRYYNGKLATVVALEEDKVEVELADSDTKLVLEKEEWENKKYQLSKDQKDLEEEVLGTFTQYPIKLAWAVTVHKCQGLTFDKAVIDVGDAFAPGQVYVALSRLRSLDGLILTNTISASAVRTDAEVVRYTQSRDQQAALKDMLKAGQAQYVHVLLASTFDFSSIQAQIDALRQDDGKEMEFEDDEMRSALELLSQKLASEATNTAKFSRQLQSKLASEEQVVLLERLEKGSAYYLQFLEACLSDLLTHISHVEQFSRTQEYLATLDEIDLSILQKMKDIEKVAWLSSCILSGKDLRKEKPPLAKSGNARSRLIEKARQKADLSPKNASGVSGKKRKKKAGAKQPKGATYEVSYALFDEGKGIEEVAKERGMAQSTIEGHAAKGIAAGRLDLDDFVDKVTLKAISQELKKSQDRATIYAALKGKYSYAQIQMVKAGLKDGKE